MKPNPLTDEASALDSEEEEIHTIESFKKKYRTGRTKTYELLNAGALRGKKNGKATLITNAPQWYRDLPDFKPEV